MPMGPMPGPPPPWGMQKVLCRLRWHTSAPMWPGLVRPTCRWQGDGERMRRGAGGGGIQHGMYVAMHPGCDKEAHSTQCILPAVQQVGAWQIQKGQCPLPISNVFARSEFLVPAVKAWRRCIILLHTHRLHQLLLPSAPPFLAAHRLHESYSPSPPAWAGVLLSNLSPRMVHPPPLPPAPSP
jgi:hypothetical protein